MIRFAFVQLLSAALAAALSAPPASAAPWAQPEDKLVRSVDACLHGKRPPNDVWKKYGRPANARATGPSANWNALAMAVGACVRDRLAIAALRLVMAEPNDYAQGETATDDGHSALRFYGLYLARIEMREAGDAALADAIEAEIMQWWALHFLTNASADSPDRAIFVTAGQRPVAASEGRGLEEYYFFRGRGLSHLRSSQLLAPGVKAADRIRDHQEPFTAHRFADAVSGDLRSDVTRLTDAYATGGWPAVGAFVTKGSRGSLHFLRFSAGGYISISEREFGPPAPRWVAMAERDGPAVQFPAPSTPRRSRAGGARLDLERRRVLAHDEIHGSFSRPFPAGEVVYHLHLDSTGVHILTGAPKRP